MRDRGDPDLTGVAELWELARLPRLRGERVELRALSKDDAPAVLEVFGDSEVTRFMSISTLPDLAAAERFVGELDELFASRTLCQWGVSTIDDGGVVGTCTLFSLSEQHRRAEVGFALGRAAWGRGLAHDALTALIGYAFSELDLHRLEADVDPRNERSLRTLGRLGFRREGLLRQRWCISGEVQDSVMLGLLTTDWRR